MDPEKAKELELYWLILPPKRVPLPKLTVKAVKSTVILPPAPVCAASNCAPTPPFKRVCSLSNAVVAVCNDDVSWKMKRTAVLAKSMMVGVTAVVSGEVVCPVVEAPDVGAAAEPEAAAPDGAAKMMLLEVWAEARG